MQIDRPYKCIMNIIPLNQVYYSTNHPSYKKLVGWNISIEDQGDSWLMSAKKPGKSVRQVSVTKVQVPVEKIHQHTATTFAAIL